VERREVRSRHTGRVDRVANGRDLTVTDVPSDLGSSFVSAVFTHTEVQPELLAHGPDAVPAVFVSIAAMQHEPPPPPPPFEAPPWPPQHGSRLRFVVLVVVAALLAGALGTVAALLMRSHSTAAPGGAGSTPTPGAGASAQAAAAYQQAVSSARSEAGVHYVAVTGGGGGADQRIEGNAGQSTGKQVITLTSSYGAEQFTLVLQGGVVYFEGNAAALQDQLGVSSARAGSLTNTWISVKKGDGPYSVIEPGITVSDQVQEMGLTPATVSQVTENDGTPAVRIAGDVPPMNGAPSGTGHVDVAQSSHLPLQYVSTVGVSGVAVVSTVTYNEWGKAPSVSAPTGAVAWTTLGASPPPGGYGGGGGGGPTPTPQSV
jgi:hypothetical protein